MGCRSISLSVVASSFLACAVAMAQAVPAKPLDLTPPVTDKKASPRTVEDAETLKQKKADCKAQAQKLFSGQQKKFMKECMAAKS